MNEITIIVGMIAASAVGIAISWTLAAWNAPSVHETCERLREQVRENEKTPEGRECNRRLSEWLRTVV